MNRTKATIFYLGFNYTLMTNLIFPALPGIQKAYHLSATQLSLIASIPALINILFQPIAGWLSDRVDRRMIIFLALGAYALGSSTVAVILFTVSTYGLVLLGRSLMGLGELGAFPQYLALIREKLPADERQGTMGTMEVFTSLGGVIGPSIGGFLASVSIGLPFWGSALAAVGAGAIFYITMQTGNKTPEGVNIQDPIVINEKHKRVFHHSFLGGYIVLGTLVACQTFVGSYVNQAYGFLPKQIGFTLAVIPLTMALGAFMMVRFGRESINNIPLTGMGFLGLLGVFVLAWTRQSWMVIMGLALIGTALGFWLPVMDHDISEAGSTKTSGIRLSFFQQSKSLGILTLPPIIGLAIDNINSYRMTFTILGFICLVIGTNTLRIRGKRLKCTVQSTQ